MTVPDIMRIGYFADGPWSHKTLAKIFEDTTLSVSFICARFDNPDQTLKDISEKMKIPFIVHKNVNSDDFHSKLKGFDFDIFVSMSFNQIFREKTFSLPKFTTINCHAGLLPFYRGRNVLNWVLINDEQHFGITVHYIDHGIDTGDIILQQTFEISDEDDYSTLLNRSHHSCSELLVQAIKLIQSGKATRIKQNSIHPVGSYCTRRKTGDELIDWNWPSRRIFNFVRAITSPGPGAQTCHLEKKVKIHKVVMVEQATDYIDVPGAIIEKTKNTFTVKTGDSCIKVLDWEANCSLMVGDRLL